MFPGSFDKLEKRKVQGSYRELSKSVFKHDFRSNDYLGISRILPAGPHAFEGSTGSRLISGNPPEAEACEEFLASFFEAEAALIFNSGYDANLGLFASVAGREDLILYDEYIHASVRDGIRLSLAKSFSFRHNDPEDLEKKLRRAVSQYRSVFIAVESLYSMDGDFSPLSELADMSHKYGGFLIVDEAHSGGVFGPEGKGLCIEQGLAERIFARLITFGKAYGTHGACVLGSSSLKSFLVNFARSFIYTTALPPAQYTTIRTAVELARSGKFQTALQENIRHFISRNSSFIRLSQPGSPIQVLCFEHLAILDAVSCQLQLRDFGVKAMLSPTVPKGKERIRVCLHAFNSKAGIDAFSQVLASAGELNSR